LRLRLLSPVLYYTVFGEEGGKFDISIEISDRFSFLFRNNYRRFLFRNVIITAMSSSMSRMADMHREICRGK
jgi:hypothetical protein